MSDKKPEKKKSNLTLKQQYVATRKGTQLALMQVRQGQAALKQLIKDNDEKNLRIMLMDCMHDAKLDGCDRDTLVELAFFALREFTMVQNLLSLRESAASAVIEGKGRKKLKG